MLILCMYWLYMPLPWLFNAGSSTYHNMAVRASSGGSLLYDGYAGNFVPTQTHSDGNEATSNGVEVGCICFEYECYLKC